MPLDSELWIGPGPSLSAAHMRLFALQDAKNSALALWSTSARQLLKLPGGLAYRADFIEVDPARLDSGVGTFLLALIACRTIEVGAAQLVLGSLPETTGFYAGLGAQLGGVQGWRSPRGTVAVAFGSESLKELHEVANGLRESES